MPRTVSSLCRAAAQFNFTLHWTGSSQFSLLQWVRRWRLLPASELRVRPKHGSYEHSRQRNKARLDYRRHK